MCVYRVLCTAYTCNTAQRVVPDTQTIMERSHTFAHISTVTLPKQVQEYELVCPPNVIVQKNIVHVFIFFWNCIRKGGVVTMSITFDTNTFQMKTRLNYHSLTPSVPCMMVWEELLVCESGSSIRATDTDDKILYTVSESRHDLRTDFENGIRCLAALTKKGLCIGTQDRINVYEVDTKRNVLKLVNMHIVPPGKQLRAVIGFHSHLIIQFDGKNDLYVNRRGGGGQMMDIPHVKFEISESTNVNHFFRPTDNELVYISTFEDYCKFVYHPDSDQVTNNPVSLPGLDSTGVEHSNFRFFCDRYLIASHQDCSTIRDICTGATVARLDGIQFGDTRHQHRSNVQATLDTNTGRMYIVDPTQHCMVVLQEEGNGDDGVARDLHQLCVTETQSMDCE